MNAESLPSRAHVLIVDESAESREVLCTMLRRHGWETLEAAGAQQGLALAHQCAPHVIVADLEADAQRDERVCAEYAAASREQNAQLVVVGVARQAAPQLPPDCVVSKPYHYGPLLRKIEQLCRRAVAEDPRGPQHRAGQQPAGQHPLEQCRAGQRAA